MVVPNPNSKPLEVHGEDGQVIAYIVSVEEMKRLHDEAESLRDQFAAAIRQRDHHFAHVVEQLKTLHPLPPTEEEMLAAVDNSYLIREIIADLESRSR